MKASSVTYKVISGKNGSSDKRQSKREKIMWAPFASSMKAWQLSLDRFQVSLKPVPVRGSCSNAFSARSELRRGFRTPQKHESLSSRSTDFRPQ